MAINFLPRAGMVLICDFRGSVAPEICKPRPVVVITPDHIWRWQLASIVPLSTTRPDPIREYHYRLKRLPFRSEAIETWAKCDLVMSVAYARLDRVLLSTGRYAIGHVGPDELLQIRIAAARSFGVDGVALRA